MHVVYSQEMNLNGTVKSQILLVEDNPELQELVRVILVDHDVTMASTLEFARQTLSKKKFDLIIIDLHLPDGDGMELLSLPEFKHTDFVILTGQSDVLRKVAAFSLGAQDYITKPFHPFELAARINAKLKARKQKSLQVTKLKFKRLILDLDHHEAVVEGVPPTAATRALDLTPKEFKLLRLLMEHVGKVYSREKLLNHVWGANVSVADRSVDQHMSHLRKKIHASGVRIQSIAGEGYKLSDDAASSEGGEKDFLSG